MFLTILRMCAGTAVVGVTAMVQVLICLVLLPSRTARIRSCIVFQRATGGLCLWLCGSTLTVTGKEHLDKNRPAIYVVNHTSMVDLFIALKLMPLGSVGIVKKEVIYYPFFGQLYLLTGHLRVDRSRNDKAVASMKELGELVRKARLSIFMSPEGTRSRDGRLLPFKKGPAHMAMQTGLPVVPVVVHGAYRAWQRGKFAIRATNIKVQVFPAIDTSAWTPEKSEEATRQIRQVFLDHLADDQLPLAP